MPNTSRNGPQTAPNSHANRQQHSPRSRKQNNIQPQRTKAMDMRYQWLRCREAQRQFQFFWRPGPNDRADYWTKHHCTAHHIEKHPEILTPKIVLDALYAHQRNGRQLSHLQQPHNIHTAHYIEVLKGCVRYLLHLATWEYGIPT
jgi:hypothetical protein